jgi:LVIVD repeat-containing protein
MRKGHVMAIRCILPVIFCLLLTVPGMRGAAATASHVQLVGHDPLFGRGMNAALAIYDHFVYIGSRTDGSSICVGAAGLPAGSACAHPHPGILIVDIKNPAKPGVVGEIGRPIAGRIGVTTRELRVWPEEKLLVVMSFRCSASIHACAKGTDKQFPFDISFFDLADPKHPRFVSRYVPTSRAGTPVKPHEMYLWIDPHNLGRALLFLSTPTTSTNPSLPNLIVADISRVSAGGAVSEVAEGNWNSQFPGTDRSDYPFISESRGTCGPYDCNLFVHSMSVSSDGDRTYLSMEAGQFLILDTSSVARAGERGPVISLNPTLITKPVDRPVWGQTPSDPHAVPNNCKKACANGHSAVKVPGRPLVVTTDEVYGTFTSPDAGCPWGWERLIDIRDEAHPKIVGEVKISQDMPSFCNSAGDDARTEQYTSYSSHNPTVLPDLAIATWHSGGLQITDISSASHPTQAGSYVPSPLARVATEDPALGRGAGKVIFWSYPIIKDGLIYLIDVRNGLYILRYTGPHADEIAKVKFFEGNSNLGDAARLESSQP